MNRLKVMASIAACDEEKNIYNLLSILNDEKDIDKILVVSSSSDRTNEIVQDFSRKKRSKVTLIIEEERKGKAIAFNKIIEECQKGNYDILVYTGGDNLPVKGAIKELLKGFKDENVGVVGAKAEPIDNPATFMGWITHLQWNMLHNIQEEFGAKVSGDLMAFKADVTKEVPIAIINDDVYIQMMAEIKGYKSKYCPSALVKLKGCSSIEDFIKQRRRIYLGYLQILFLTGIKSSTMKWRIYHRVLKKSLPSFGIKEFFYLTSAIILQYWAYLLALKDFHLYKIPYKWEIAKTTRVSLKEKQ